MAELRGNPIHRYCAPLALVATLASANCSLGQCEIAQLSSPGGEYGDLFGFAVSLHGDFAAVGADCFDGVDGIIVFRRDEVGWAPHTTILDPQPDGDDSFGKDVALFADVLAVSDTRDNRRGAVHVYRYDGVDWKPETTLRAPDGEPGDDFGFRIAMDRDVLLIGARKDTVEGFREAGSAYVYRYNGSDWLQEAKLTDEQPGLLELFGGDVAVSGDWAVVAEKTQRHPRCCTGNVFVYRFDGVGWPLHQQFGPSDNRGNDYACSVSIAGDLIVVGAKWDSTYANQAGAAYVYVLDGDVWREQAKLHPSDPRQGGMFGWDTAIGDSADIFLISAPRRNGATGLTYVFGRDRATGRWPELTRLAPKRSSPGDTFGIGLSLHGDTMLAGAKGISEEPGSAYIFGGLVDQDCNRNGIRDGCEHSALERYDGRAFDAAGCDRRGDINDDGLVDPSDLLILLSAWGPCSPQCPPRCAADLDHDCRVGFQDLVVMLSNWR